MDTSLTPKKIITLPKGAKLQSFVQFAQKAGIKFKDSGSLVISDRDNNPRVFVFDAYSLWDLFCTLDEKLEKVLPAREYIFKNPVGWLIDAIEDQLPPCQEVITEIEEAQKELS